VLVHQDPEQLLPDLVTRLVVRGAGGGELERLPPLSRVSQISPYGVSTSNPSVGGSSYSLTAGSIALTMSADDFRRATSGLLSGPASLPSGTRSRSVQVCTPSSPRLGSTSAT